MSYTLDDAPQENNSYGKTSELAPNPSTSASADNTSDIAYLQELISVDAVARKRSFIALLRAITSGRGV